MNNIIFGKNVIFTILKDKKNLIKKIFLTKDNKIYFELKNKGIQIEFWTKKKFDKSFPKLNHQKIAAEIKDYEYYSFDKFLENHKKTLNKKLILILDHIQDSFNFGGIIRSSVAAAVDAIIIPKIKQTLVTNSVIKATTGNILKIKIIRVVNLNRIIDILKKNEFWIFSSDLENAQDYRKINYENTNIALIIGNENKGISKSLIKKSDFIIKLPMKHTESLNVSVATAILIYEIRNKQKFW